MRKIKFRGLRHLDNGKTEWVYGFYVERWNNKRCICQYNPKEIPGKPNEYEDNWDIFVDVYEDSIDQFTGLTDKNGTEIYEGDILQREDETWIVAWNKDKGGFIVEQPTTTNDYCWYWLGFGNNKTMTVIGNIHNNPIEE